MKKKVRTPKEEAQASGCGTGCISYIVIALILGYFIDDDDTATGAAVALAGILGYGVYKNALPKLEKQAAEKKKALSKLEKQAAEKKKAAVDATKKERKRVEKKLEKIKSDVGIEDYEENEEDQMRRYQQYLDSIKKKK